jgi:predicted phage baseplate assembly protein
VLPTPIVDPVTGNEIELTGLFPGIDTGRRLLLTGVRTDLPQGASVVEGEIVLVEAVQQKVTRDGDTPHTLLTLAAPLRHSYRLGSVQLYGNVVSAHQGATINENLVATGGDRAHPSFTLAQAPVLADPAATAAGSVLSLTVTVDGRRWNPVPRFGGATPPRSYLTGTDHQGRTTITFGQALPYPDSTVTATYRVGHGALGNVRAGQLTQALSRPLAVGGVDNPLPATGGADPVGPDVVRANAPVGLQALARVVSVADAADIAVSWAGIGKADAQLCGDGQRQVLAVTVGGVAPVPLEPDSELCVNVAAALRAAGDPAVPVVVLPAVLSLIMLVAEVSHDPDISWDTVQHAVRVALLDAFGYPRRRLGEDVVLSDLVAIAHRIPEVRSFVISGIDVVDATKPTRELAELVTHLTPPRPEGRILIPPTSADGGKGAHVAYLSDLVADTLKLQEHRP